jgi:hypothetical protein
MCSGMSLGCPNCRGFQLLFFFLFKVAVSCLKIVVYMELNINNEKWQCCIAYRKGSQGGL